MKDDYLTLRISPDLADALARRAAAEQVSKSQVVREAVEYYLAPAPIHIPAERAVTGLELAERIRRLARLGEEEAALMASDIEEARKDLDAPKPPWD
ncbi:MAG: ribbon-helix-helix protein, CopG family [Gemmatimonadota bacterium]|nr:ribbon-helix-helix protein, CopG family [Gemmatimonadota bacterium]